MKAPSAASPFAAIPARAWALLPALAVAWGSTWPMMKVATSEVPIFSFRAITAVLACLALFAVTRARYGRILPQAKEWRGILACGAVSVSAWFYLSALSVTLLPAGRAAMLAYTMPLWAFLIGVVFLREPILARRVLGVAAGLSAIALLAWDDLTQAAGGGIPWGVAAITGAAIVWSIGSTLHKEMRFESPVMLVVAWQLAFGALPLVGLALWLETPAWIETLSLSAAGAAVSVAFLSQAFGMWAWFTLLTLTSVAFGSLAVLCVPMVGLALSGLLLGEGFGPVEAGGFALITLGLGVVLPFDRLFTRRQPPPAV